MGALRLLLIRLKRNVTPNATQFFDVKADLSDLFGPLCAPAGKTVTFRAGLRLYARNLRKKRRHSGTTDPARSPKKSEGREDLLAPLAMSDRTLVRMKRLELSLRLRNSDLNAARLPIPPHPHGVWFRTPAI
jgi:hypothetical protein